ncbi:hypothetical protein CkaCkLH20_09592 [Colletotrichum karsti]|uniref:Uncharacterized protein n=1 Tax=Colletotrichum karsti TaxID=1095194 RepID=A0A9P6HZM5_9PEZI|nr:uncharacterized protein CkaCkLH20_09592 [Colletotrichum karsti]KAF9873082.1 hypothetical protein CkaCkLH20_09592 [Colletotrichum karsti]
MITSSAIDQTSDLHWEDSDVNATFPYNHFFNATIQNITTTTRTEEQNVIAYREIRSSLYFAWSFAESSPDITTARIPLFCSETKCQWQKITSLDIDYQCRSAPTDMDDDNFGYSNQANITSRVGITGPNGMSNFTSAQIRLKASHKVPSDSTFHPAFSDNPGLILHLAGIAEVGDQQFEAAECVFYWRVKRMTNVVYHAVNQSLEKNEDYDNSRPEIGLVNNRSSLVFEGHCNDNTIKDQTSMDVSGIDNCTYAVTLDAHAGVRELLIKFLPGQVVREEQNGETVYRPNTTAIDLFQWTWRRVQADNSEPTPLNKTMQIYSNNVSKMISYNIRCLSNNTISGQVGLYGQFFKIDTLYVLYPGLLLVFSTYLLAYTIWRSWNEPTWKTSLLPLLYHGLESPALDHGRASTNLAWMKKSGDHKKVVLRDNDDGLGLKLRVS